MPRQHRTVTVPDEDCSQNLSVVEQLKWADLTPHCAPVPTSWTLHVVEPLCPDGEDLRPPRIRSAHPSLDTGTEQTADGAGTTHSVVSLTRIPLRFAGVCDASSALHSGGQTNHPTTCGRAAHCIARPLLPRHMQLLWPKPTGILRAAGVSV